MSDLRERVQAIVDDIGLPPQYEVRVGEDDKGVHIEVWCWRADIVTGEMGWGQGGKRYLNEVMVKSEVVRLILGAYLGYVEHEARETFRYRGRLIFGPHTDVDALWSVARRIDVRPPVEVAS